MNCKSSNEKTLPVGLCGELTRMAFVFSEKAASSSAQQALYGWHGSLAHSSPQSGTKTELH